MASILASAAEEIQRAKEIDFTNAFNANRGVLAGFAKCNSESELHIVKDGFLLALGRELCPAEYEPVKKSIVEDFKVAAAAGSAGGFQQTIESDKQCTFSMGHMISSDGCSRCSRSAPCNI